MWIVLSQFKNCERPDLMGTWFLFLGINRIKSVQCFMLSPFVIELYGVLYSNTVSVTDGSVQIH